MLNAGINRIVINDIVNGSGAWRFAFSRVRWGFAQRLYRRTFELMNCQLLPGDTTIEVSKDQHLAGYDSLLGIDVIFKINCGMQSTLQEKILTFKDNTVTVEFLQNPKTGEEGDWFNLKAHYYFVGYCRNSTPTIQDWILLSWPATQLATCQNRINWRTRYNQHDGAKANFKWAFFDDFPVECVVARGCGFSVDLWTQSVLF